MTKEELLQAEGFTYAGHMNKLKTAGRLHYSADGVLLNDAGSVIARVLNFNDTWIKCEIKGYGRIRVDFNECNLKPVEA